MLDRYSLQVCLFSSATSLQFTITSRKVPFQVSSPPQVYSRLHVISGTFPFQLSFFRLIQFVFGNLPHSIANLSPDFFISSWNVLRLLSLSTFKSSSFTQVSSSLLLIVIGFLRLLRSTKSLFFGHVEF